MPKHEQREMKFKIYFTVGEYDDYLIVEGDSIEEIRDIASRETRARGLDEKRNNLWSEQLD